MTIACDFTRDDCELGKRRVTYAELEREYRCGDCGGRLVMRWSLDYDECWHVECLRCKSHDFIHENEQARQEWEAREVLDGLPAEVAAALGYSKPPSQPVGEIFSLCPLEPVEL